MLSAMATTHIEVPPEFDQLTRSEKLAFIDALCDRVDALQESDVALTSAQEAELRRRIELFEADPSIAEPWESVRAELLAD